MEDIQSLSDARNVPLEKVGIARLHLPVMILEQGGGYQHVVGEASLFVEVPADVRGTHMSRFVEILHEWADRPVARKDIEHLLTETADRAGSVSAEVEIAFKYFISKSAPVSGRHGVVDYGCHFLGRVDEDGFRFRLRVDVPVTTLCPCSKAISEQGAHNQRAIVTVEVESAPDAFVWLEDLITQIEDQSSCAVYSVLKREDEKWVTERAFENPKFVEDVVRDVVLAMRQNSGITGFSVECVSVESIHNHDAVASVGWTSVGALDSERLVSITASTAS